MRRFRINSIIVGIFMLIAFVFYGGGQGIVDSVLSKSVSGVISSEGKLPLVIGTVMMLVNSCLVIGIGFVMNPVLNNDQPITAKIYLTTRILEGSFLAVGAVGFLCLLIDGKSIMTVTSAIQLNFHAYQIGMMILGIGSLFMCKSLIKTKLVPIWIAAWGFFGYVVFAIGCAAELLGFHIGMYLLIPGGLFELIFPVWLLVKRFYSSQQIKVL